MTKIDWYILKKFLGTFFYAIMILTVISVVIDITEKIDDFISHHLSVSYIITHYYIGFIPHIVALLFPLFIFIAVIFFTSKMAYRLEIMAILSSGVSFHRFLRAYWIGGILLAVLLCIANQTVIPRANRVRTKFESEFVDNDKKDNILTNIHMRVDSLSYVTMNNFYTANEYASGFTLEEIRGQRLLSKLESTSISWDSTKKVWKTGRAVIRYLNGDALKVRTIADTTLKMNLSPKDLLTNTDAKESMTTPELNRYISRQVLRGSGGLNYLYVEKYRRIASAFAVIILTFIGAIIASRKVRGGSGLHLALGIVISAVYILFMQFSTTFSVKGNLSPLLAVWIPNFVFAGVAIWLYKRAPK
ncbi:MAG TPA: LptF/LptG family permease [Chitinophagaceae bacterium]|nr:LptF/LptG family permease [Chitinophagaceae bacterium]